MLGRFKSVFWGSVAAALFLPSAASAVTQPSTGGVTIPTIVASQTTCKRVAGGAPVDKNVEACLDQEEGNPANIDAQKDALVAPETFQPTCQLTFTPIVKGGSIYDVFGWYNVKPDPVTPGKFLKPTQAELYGMFVTNDFKDSTQLTGQSVVLDLGVEAAAGRYKGGQIAFFLVSTSDVLSIDPVTHAVIGTIRFQFHTQHDLNAGSVPGKTYYNVLTWESIAKKNTFYFGWEDLPTDQGGDNDFDDFLFSVSGVQCGGGGQPCDTGMMGVCAAGVLQCKKGVIACVQTLDSMPETCNALDDDCDGMVDNGDGLCKEDEICNAGVCVPKCGTGEFRCPAGSVCIASGVCVDPACKDVDCPEGKICQAGECVDSCTGITCPHGLSCRNGGCVDPCIGVECDDGFACVDGICTSCECSACMDGQECHDSTSSVGVKLCMDTGCEAQTCKDHTHCALGNCVDDCDGAACPVGQICAQGACIADGSFIPGTGGTDGTGGGGIVIIHGGTTSTGATGSGADSSGANRSGTPVTTDQKSCNCTVPGGKTSGGGALLLLALFGISRRRRGSARAA
jgi:MYXO-CTERM domain-containing protein